MFLLIFFWRLERLDSCRISIHLMFLLIVFLFILPIITCVISIHLMFLLIRKRTERTSVRNYFNTSHVSINPIGTSHSTGISAHFNTSHVSINRIRLLLDWFCIPISIHLMFLLIKYKAVHILVLEKFQYISCFY